MADKTYVTKVYETDGGNTIVVASGGKISFDAGGAIDLSAGGAIILPTADPKVVGALWDNVGVITISAG